MAATERGARSEKSPGGASEASRARARRTEQKLGDARKMVDDDHGIGFGKSPGELRSLLNRRTLTFVSDSAAFCSIQIPNSKRAPRLLRFLEPAPLLSHWSLRRIYISRTWTHQVPELKIVKHLQMVIGRFVPTIHEAG